MIDKGRFYCGKVQTTWGTAETDIDGGDFLEVNEDAALDLINENEENPTVNGGFGQNLHIIGAMRAESTLPFNMRSFGAAAAPDWMSVAPAAGFALTPTVATGGTRYAIAPAASSEKKDMTLWEYNGGQVIRAANLVYDWEISGELNKKAVFSMINGKGAVPSVPAALSAVTVTKNGTVTPAIVPLTKTILGSAVYSPLSFKFMGNTVVEQFVDGTTLGYGKSEITDRKIKFELTVYSEIPSSVDPYTAMRANGESVISLEWGSTGRKIKIYTASANIGDIKKSKSGNLLTWTITGLIADDDFTVTANSDLANA